MHFLLLPQLGKFPGFVVEVVLEGSKVTFEPNVTDIEVRMYSH